MSRGEFWEKVFVVVCYILAAIGLLWGDWWRLQ